MTRWAMFVSWLLVEVFIEASLSDENGIIYATMEGVSIAGVNLQKEETELDLRQWRFDDDRRIMYDSAWSVCPQPRDWEILKGKPS
mmetsp:Transcript_150772/g.482519  ORF Transcript_150772/g.482519 Transcript_150772/m.482519 type:complete len:86 (-) Transcript_150772:9-266(-)